MCIYGLVLVNILLLRLCINFISQCKRRCTHTIPQTSSNAASCKQFAIYEYKTMDSSSNHYRILFMNNPSRRLFLGFLADPCLIGCFVGCKVGMALLSWVVKIRLVQQVLDAQQNLSDRDCWLPSFIRI